MHVRKNRFATGFGTGPRFFASLLRTTNKKIINKSLNHVLIDGTQASQPVLSKARFCLSRGVPGAIVCAGRRYLSFAKLKPVDQSEAGAKQRQQQQWSNDVKTLREFPDPPPLRVHVCWRRSTSQGVKHFHTLWRPREVLVLKTHPHCCAD
uniref:(northern house mosquito) hypothetical protein n=1 Tax=Culex pipiens TaxID=7175 RepID=A0A8D8CA79_CULPI